jgi:DNA-directed RNA polymerase specialized sigma subunit
MSHQADGNHRHRPYPRVVAYPPKPQRHRPVHPHAAANALAMQHIDIAEKVALNIARRTGHPADDLRQIAMLGILQASRRYSSVRGSFRAYARTYANGEVYHFLREKGFLLKVSPRWRELHARGQKLIRLGTTPQNIPGALGISKEQWEEIVLACSQRVVALDCSASTPLAAHQPD